MPHRTTLRSLSALDFAASLPHFSEQLHSREAPASTLFTPNLLVDIRHCTGLFVSLSTFLFIKSTGPLTYNIVGHLKTISILTTGYLFFQEDMNTKKV